MNETIERIPKLKGYNCFACGTANPIGLNLNFYRRGEYICSDVTLGKNYEGWENMAHGGIASTLLDEIMSWTVMYFKRSFIVTRSMTIKYRRPVPLYRQLTVKGRINKGGNNRLCKAEGLIQENDKDILVRAEATFAILSDNELSMVPDTLKKEMMNLFKNF
ncbi:MAG TPA: PaaI family thioesterase [Desulfatiglandales bacterium]|nr:PaaI family thioesterase [Desulfatiglandales bacterium]